MRFLYSVLDRLISIIIITRWVDGSRPREEKTTRDTAGYGSSTICPSPTSRNSTRPSTFPLDRDVTRENYHKRTDVSPGRKEGRSSPAAMKNDAVSLGKQSWNSWLESFCASVCGTIARSRTTSGFERHLAFRSFRAVDK